MNKKIKMLAEVIDKQLQYVQIEGYKNITLWGGIENRIVLGEEKEQFMHFFIFNNETKEVIYNSNYNQRYTTDYFLNRFAQIQQMLFYAYYPGNREKYNFIDVLDRFFDNSFNYIIKKFYIEKSRELESEGAKRKQEEIKKEVSILIEKIESIFTIENKEAEEKELFIVKNNINHIYIVNYSKENIKKYGIDRVKRMLNSICNVTDAGIEIDNIIKKDKFKKEIELVKFIDSGCNYLDNIKNILKAIDTCKKNDWCLEFMLKEVLKNDLNLYNSR